MISSET